jgi:hypothetical protein
MMLAVAIDDEKSSKLQLAKVHAALLTASIRTLSWRCERSESVRAHANFACNRVWEKQIREAVQGVFARAIDS